MFSGHSLPAKQRVSLVAFLSALVGRGGQDVSWFLLVPFFFSEAKVVQASVGRKNRTEPEHCCRK